MTIAFEATNRLFCVGTRLKWKLIGDFEWKYSIWNWFGTFKDGFEIFLSESK